MDQVWIFIGIMATWFAIFVLVTAIIVSPPLQAIKLVNVITKAVREFLRQLRRSGRRSIFPLIICALGFLGVLSAPLLAEIAAPLDRQIAIWWIQAIHRGPAKEAPSRVALLTDHFFAEIGIALIVAGLMAIFVEFIFRYREEQELEADRRKDEVRHRNQLDQISRGVFNSLLGGFAPEWLSIQVFDLYKTHLLREVVVITYTFESGPVTVEGLRNYRRPDVHDILKVGLRIEYRLRNLTDRPTPSEISHRFTPTVPLPGRYGGFKNLLIKDSSGKPTVSWHEGVFDKRVRCEIPADDEPLGWKKRTIAVTDDFLISPKDTVQVEIELTSVRWLNDHIPWITRIPADSIKVVTRVEPGCVNLDFALSEGCAKPFKEVVPAREWHSDGQLMAFQGFTLHWFPASV
ncbi:MAG: hypothetical protein WCE87_13525 [Candidatus Udaeobacter sp.]